MSWDELETRLRQEFSKRIDVALCGIGLRPGRNGVCLSSEIRGNFFFTPPEVSQRVGLIREHMLEHAAKIVADADEIRSHRFRLLGYRNLQYGEEIDWHLDAVHGLRSPLIPWFKINFLDFDEVGDHKVTWELNRHQHLVTLAKAWLLTGNGGYVEEIVAQWHSWQRANPYPLGANWASSLEVAFRSLSWIWVDHLLMNCPSVPSGFREDLLHGLALNGRHIERYLSTYFSPNTHLLGEAVVLFFIGTLYPQILSAARWKELGWQTVQQEAVRQVRPDGVYFEQTLYYHVYALDFLLYARLLASRNSVEIPADFDQVIRRMLGVIQALSQAGPPDGFGDDDGGRLFDSSRNHAEHMTDPLPIGAALFQDESLQDANLTEEAIWLFGNQAIAFAKKGESTAATSLFFPHGGIYVLTDSEPFPQQLVIDAGPQGTGHCGHGHADALSVRLSFAGRRWLVDPGTCCYIGPDNNRDTFRGTRAHNTLAVDGLDQAQPEGPFAWSFIPTTEVETWISRPTFTLLVASHSGYERLRQRARHQRFIFHFERNLYLIRDLAIGEGTHLLETAWHFAPDLDVTPSGKSFVAVPKDMRPGEGKIPRLSVIPVENPSWKAGLRSEYVSPAYGEKAGAQVMRCSTAVALPAETAVVLIADLGGRTTRDAPARFTRETLAKETTDNPAAVYRYEHGDISYTVTFRQAGESKWAVGPWASDAQVLCVRKTGGRLDRILLVDGSFVEFHQKQVLSHGAPLQWLEWNIEENRQGVSCSDPAAVGSFNPSVLA